MGLFICLSALACGGLHGGCVDMRGRFRRLAPQEGDEEVREVLHQLKVMAGLSSDDPPDSEWIKLEKTDKKTGKKVQSNTFIRLRILRHLNGLYP